MRWALVTGGAKHLGAEMIRMFAKEKRNCVIHYRHSKQQAEQLQKELHQWDVNAETIQGDFTTVDSTRTFLQEYLNRFKETEILVNNVGNYLLGTATMTTPESASELFQVNVNAALMCVQALLPSLKKCQGRIINIGMAGSSLNVANTHATVYNMTKLSLSMLTKSLAKELAPFQISVNMVSPGYLETSTDFPQDSHHIPWGRPAALSEIVEAVRFLTSTPAGCTTGQNLEIAGGTRI